MTARALNLAILLTAIGIIGGAWFFQLVIHLSPCELCLKERFPWYGAIALAAAGLTVPIVGQSSLLRLMFFLVFLGSACFALYHVGVEQHWIVGPTACTGATHKALSIEELTAQLIATPVVQCDQVQWSLFGISLAGWNMVASLSVVGLIIHAWMKRGLVGTGR